VTEAQIEYARLNRLYRAEIERVAELDWRTGRLHKASQRITAYFRAHWRAEGFPDGSPFA
jgi:hypothetical protein